MRITVTKTLATSSEIDMDQMAVLVKGTTLVVEKMATTP